MNYPDVVTASDYYPGGMDMSGRQYNAATGYRYGFNGKEKDKESAVQYDYGFRIYDPRLVRFKSVDPLANSYPYYTPYQFAGNSPIELIDIDGGEGGKVIIDGINTIVDGIKNFFSFKSEREEIQQGASNITEGVSKQVIGPWDWRYFNSENPGLDFELRRIDGQIQSTIGTVQISSGIQGISNKVETVFAVAVIIKNTTKPAIKKIVSNETNSVASHPTPPIDPVKSKTSTWVEEGKVSPDLVKQYNKLNAKERPYLKHTPAGKNVVKDINKEVNNGNMKCVGCDQPVVPAPKSKKGVTPAPNEAHVDHVKRREDGGSGTPKNGDVLCENCNVRVKH